MEEGVNFDRSDAMDGDPLFREEDVHNTSHPLMKILRRILVDDKVSKEYITDRYAEYARVVLGETPSRISSGRGNLLSTLARNEITYKKFVEILECILGYSVDISVTLVDKKATVRSFTYSNINTSAHRQVQL
jgi:predicted nuclease of restriction endonuclease-like RecB superfamily